MYLHCTGGVKCSILFEKPSATPKRHKEKRAFPTVCSAQKMLPRRKRKGNFSWHSSATNYQTPERYRRDKFAVQNISIICLFDSRQMDQNSILQDHTLTSPSEVRFSTSLADCDVVNQMFSLRPLFRYCCHLNLFIFYILCENNLCSSLT